MILFVNNEENSFLLSENEIRQIISGSVKTTYDTIKSEMVGTLPTFESICTSSFIETIGDSQIAELMKNMDIFRFSESL